MRTIAGAALTAMQSGAFAKRSLVRFGITGAVAGFWDDGYDLSFGGETYYGLGGAMQITSFASGTDLAVRNVDIVISGLDPNAATLVEGAAWHQVPVTIYEAIMAVDTPQILNIDTWFTGFLDQLQRTEVIGSPAKLIAKCEPITREFARKGARTRSDADQRQVDTSDGFYKFAATVGNTSINWGVKPEQPQQQRKKFLGLF